MHRAQIAISWACCTAALHRMPPDSLWASKIVADEFTLELAVEADCMVCPVTWYEMGRCFRMMVYDDLGMRTILEVPSKKNCMASTTTSGITHIVVSQVCFSVFSIFNKVFDRDTQSTVHTKRCLFLDWNKSAGTQPSPVFCIYTALSLLWQ